MKITHVTLLENTATHIIIEITGFTKSLFGKPKPFKIKVYKKNFCTFYESLTGEHIPFENSHQINAFLSTGLKQMSFVSE